MAFHIILFHLQDCNSYLQGLIFRTFAATKTTIQLCPDLNFLEQKNEKK